MKKASIRTVRNTFSKITSRPYNSLWNLEKIRKTMIQYPRDILKTWKDNINNSEKKKLLNEKRYGFLKNGLRSVCARTIKSSFSEILTKPNLVKKGLNRIQNIMKQNIRDSLGKWKDYVSLCKNGDFFNSMRTEKLKARLLSITRRSANSVVERIIGDGSRLKGALKLLLTNIEKRLKSSLQT